MAIQTAKSLVTRGDKVRVILPSGGPLVSTLKDIGVDVEILNVQVLRKSDLRLSSFGKLTVSIFRSIWNAVKTIRRERPDIVYVNTMVQPFWLVAAKLCRVNSLVHVREAEDSQPWIVKRLLNAPLILASEIVCNSQATSNLVRNNILKTKKSISVIYNGKDWGPYQCAPLSVVLETPIKLLVIGRLSPRKGQDIAITAVSNLRDRGYEVEIEFAGDVYEGYEWYASLLEETAANLGVAEYCRFLGFQADIQPALSRASIAIVPSRIEPFGTVAAESMVAGVPTIVSKVQGLAEIVEDGVSGLLFESEDPDDLAEKCEWVIRNWGAALSIGATGRERILSEFSVETYERLIATAIDRISHSGAR